MSNLNDQVPPSFSKDEQPPTEQNPPATEGYGTITIQKSDE